MAVQDFVSLFCHPRDLIKIFEKCSKRQTLLQLHPKMTIYAVTGKQYALFSQKQAYSPGGMPRQRYYLKCKPAEVDNFAVIDLLERRHFKLLFSAKLHKSGKTGMLSSNLRITGMQKAIAIKVQITENMVTVAVCIYHCKRQVGDCPDNRMNICDTVHCINDHSFLLAAHQITGGLAFIVHKPYTVVDFFDLYPVFHADTPSP